MSIIYTPEEMNDAIARVSEYDLVSVDTAGFSHRNEAQCQDMKKLIDGLDEAYEKEVYLVLSATTKYKDLLEIADTYKEIANYKLIFTKLDETITYGNSLNIKLYSGAKLSYMTSGKYDLIKGMEFTGAVNTCRLDERQRQRTFHILFHVEKCNRCSNSRHDQRNKGILQVHLSNQLYKSKRRYLCRDHHDHQDEWINEFFQSKVICMNRVSRHS